MPYIITTHPADDDRYATRAEQIVTTGLTRRAVATLDEARGIAFCATEAGVAEALNLPESGGTIGPLPDGSVVDVARVSWPYLQAGRTRSSDHATVIDAYNARP